MLSLHRRKRLLFFAAATATTALAVAFPSITFIVADNTSAATHVIPEGYTTITDPNFYDCVAETYLSIFPGADISEGLTDYQLSQLTSLNCNKTSSTPNDEKIFETTGLEKMTGLTQLSLTYNNLTDGLLDISHNTALTQLDVSRNYLQSLDASHNTALTSLIAANNNLSSVTIPTTTTLTSIDVNHNMLENLDISGATALTSLAIHNNTISSIDLSNNTALTSFVATSNRLTSIDISHNTALVTLNAGGNQLTSLDASSNPNLQRIIVVNNQLTSINVSHNPALRWFNVGSNQLTSLDVSHNPELLDLYVNGNQLTSLDVSHNPNLALLEADNIYVWANPEVLSLDPNVEIGLSSVNFLQPNQTIPDTENYTYDSANKIVTINNLDGIDGYVQVYSPTISRRYKIVIPNNFLSFNLNGGEGNFEMMECAIEYGTSECDVTLPTTQPTRANYQFLGWADAADATTAAYSAGDTLTLDSNKTIYAIWAPIHVLSFDLNTTGATGTFDDIECYSSDLSDTSCMVQIPSDEPTKEGVIFFGWGESSDVKVVAYQPGEELTLSGDKILYAVWDDNGADWNEEEYDKGESDGIEVGLVYPVSILESVLLDGVEIANSQYIVNVDNNTITLKPTYLDTLAAGDHEVTFVFEGGKTVSISITIVSEQGGGDDPSEDEPSAEPSTDENGNIVLDLSAPSIKTVTVTINIYDENGVLVKTVEVSDPGENVRVDVSDLANGSYTAELVHKDVDGNVILVTTNNFVKDDGTDMISLPVVLRVDSARQIAIEIYDENGDLARKIIIDMITGTVYVYDKDGNLIDTIENGYVDGRLVLPMDGLGTGTYSLKVSYLDENGRIIAVMNVDGIEYTGEEGDLPVPDTGSYTGAEENSAYAIFCIAPFAAIVLFAGFCAYILNRSN